MRCLLRAGTLALDDAAALISKALTSETIATGWLRCNASIRGKIRK